MLTFYLFLILKNNDLFLLGPLQIPKIQLLKKMLPINQLLVQKRCSLQPINVTSATKHLQTHIMSNFTSKLTMNRVRFLNVQCVNNHLSSKISFKCIFLQYTQLKANLIHVKCCFVEKPMPKIPTWNFI